MADPVTATIVAGASLLSASSAVQQGAAAKAAGQFNANMAERNAKVAEQQAEMIKRSSEFDINRFRDNFSDLQATAAQAFRYNGFVATGGTPLQVLLDNAREADTEIALRRYNASIGEQQALESATEQRLQGRLDRMMGRSAQKASYYQAAGSLLGGAAKISSIFGPSSVTQPQVSAYSATERAAPTFTGSTGIEFGPAEGYIGG